MVIKIAISGKMCSGKSFCSNLIKQKYPQFKLFSFAERLKSITHDLFLDQFHMVENDNVIQRKHKNRKLYVDVGQKMREIDPNVWTKYVLKQSNNVDFAIIDDLRFKNEMNALKKEGWKLVKLNITKEQQIKRLKQTYSNSKEHILGLDSDAEIDLDDVSDSCFDLILDQNDDGLSVNNLMTWVDDLVDNHPSIKNNCCKNDCSDCDDKYKMSIDNFEQYIKDNGVIC